MGRACGVLQLKSRQSAGKAGKYCDVSDGTYSDSDGVSGRRLRRKGQKETRYLLEAGVFSLVGGMVQSFAEPGARRTFGHWQYCLFI